MSLPTHTERSRWYALSAAEVQAGLQTDPANGLSAAEAASRLAADGPNALVEPPSVSPLQLLLHQFQSVLIYVLLAAAVLALLLGDTLEFVAILVIAVLNAVFGFVQEYRADKALSELKTFASPMATVVRDGHAMRAPAAEIVRGDVLLLEAGDVVAADGRVVEAVALSVSEAILTGESVPVDKDTAPVADQAELAERTSMVFQGTQVVRGRGRVIVTATAASTEMGRIAQQVASQPREETPLQADLARVGRYLAAAAALLCATVFIVGVARGIDTHEMLLTSTSLAVAAIPEGLPAAATIVLALGVQRMARRNVIVRRLSSVETLGSVNVIFTDKTGTLTENRMRVEQVWVAGELSDLVSIAALCNNATSGSDERAATGDPTEIALIEWAESEGADIEALQRDLPRVTELPFAAERARMSVVVEDGDGRVVLTKGAPDVIVSRSGSIGGAAVDSESRDDVLRRANEMAREGMRVLALAQRQGDGELSEDAIEHDLDLVGLVGMADPVRVEAPDAIAMARDAGIHVVMLTGDQPATAAAVAERLQISSDVVPGREIEDTDIAELADMLERVDVFARVTSEHKMRIIQASRESDAIVAMTGDGVNDGPALRAADVGVAMGKGGTDVAREASDLVLTDDNFSSIVAAVEEGRSINANIRRFVHFLLSCNTAEVMVVFLALTVAGEAVLTPIQILFVNLITDGLPALALGVEPADASIMRRRGSMRRGILTSRSLVPILGFGSLIAAVTLAAFAAGRAWDDDELANRLAFATLVGSQLASAAVFRNESITLLKLRRNDWLVAAIATSALLLVAVFYVPVLQDAFDTAPLDAEQWLLVAALSAVPLVIGELVKVSGVLVRLRLTPEGAGR